MWYGLQPFQLVHPPQPAAVAVKLPQFSHHDPDRKKKWGKEKKIRPKNDLEKQTKSLLGLQTAQKKSEKRSMLAVGTVKLLEVLKKGHPFKRARDLT